MFLIAEKYCTHIYAAFTYAGLTNRYPNEKLD